MTRPSPTSTPSAVSASALLVVDVQNDFCTGGALAVPGSDGVVSAMNRYLHEALATGMPVYASRDWHPAASKHFKVFGGQWPVHCVAESAGARFHPDLQLPGESIIVSTGMGVDENGYSALDGRTPDGTPMLDDLRRRGVRHLYVGGLATDYCVKHSVLDALAAGIAVTLLTDAVAGVNLSPDDSARALAEMREKGARIVEHLDHLQA